MSVYDDVEYVLAEIITEATGEPRVGRLERTLAKSALARLREMGLTLPTPPADDVREVLALTIAKTFPGWSEDTSEPLHVGWSEALRLHAEQHSQRVNDECIRQGRLYADAILSNDALEVRPRGTVTDDERTPVERFADLAADQFRADMDYDGAEVKRRILTLAHVLAPDHPRTAEECDVCRDDDKVDEQ